MWSLTFMVDGKKHVERIPDDWVKEIKPLVEKGKETKAAVGEILAVNAQLLALWRKQTKKKNKLQEKKAWAISDVARSQQALFVCMTHNLMVLVERQIERDEGIRDEKCLAKRRERIEQMKEKILQAGREPNPLVLSCTRITQRSLQFIRWLKSPSLLRPRGRPK